MFCCLKLSADNIRIRRLNYEYWKKKLHFARTDRFIDCVHGSGPNNAAMLRKEEK